MGKSVKREIDFDDEGMAHWIVRFFIDGEEQGEQVYRYKNYADEAVRNWLLERVSDFNDLAVVDTIA
jgi:hypothetical protein